MTSNPLRTIRSARFPGVLSAAAVAACLLFAQSARAATYQVGPSKQYASLQAVASLLEPGDVVEVDGDATYSGDVKLTQWGSAGQKITIRGIRVNGKRPVFSGGYNTIEVYANHYVFEALDLTGGSTRCFFHHGDDITVRDSVVHDCPGHGILGADSESGSLTLEYVEVYNAGSGDTRHPIYIATDEETYPGSVFRMQHCFVHDGKGGNNVKTRAERNEIYYNWIEGALYHELELIGPDGQDPSLAREDSDVVGNVFRKTGTSFVTRIGGDGTGDTAGRYRFVNNTFVLAAGSASVFRLFDQLESVEMHNNVFFREGGGGVKIIQDADVSWATGSAVIAGSNNWVAMGSETVPTTWSGTILGGDPGVDGSAFAPSGDSPLVDAGNAATASPAGYAFPSPLATPGFLPPAGKIEVVGSAVPRPVVGSIDVGAYEFGVDPSGSGAGGSGSSGDSSGAGASGQTSGAGAGAPSGVGGADGTGAGHDGDDFLNDEDGDDVNAPLEPTGCGCRTSAPLPAMPALLGAVVALAAAAVRRRRRG